MLGIGATETRSTLEFTPGKNTDGTLAMKSVKGSVEFPDYLIKTFAQAAANATPNDSGLVGSTISEALATSNPENRPTPAYANYNQFKHLSIADIANDTEGLEDFTVMVPKAAFTSSRAPFKMTALVQLDQNAARLVLECKFQ